MNNLAKKSTFGASLTLAFGMIAGCGNNPEIAANLARIKNNATAPIATLTDAKGYKQAYVFESTPAGAPDHLCVTVEKYTFDGGMANACFLKTAEAAQPPHNMLTPLASFTDANGHTQGYAYEYTPKAAPDHLCAITQKYASEGGLGISCFPKSAAPKP